MPPHSLARRCWEPRLSTQVAGAGPSPSNAQPRPRSRPPSMAWQGWPAPWLWVSGCWLLFFAFVLLLSPRGCQERRGFRGLLMTRSQRLLFRIGLVPRLRSVQAREGGHTGRMDLERVPGCLGLEVSKPPKQKDGEAPEFVLSFFFFLNK